MKFEVKVGKAFDDQVSVTFSENKHAGTLHIAIVAVVSAFLGGLLVYGAVTGNFVPAAKLIKGVLSAKQ